MSGSGLSSELDLLALGFAQLEVQETLGTALAAFGPVAHHCLGITLDRQIRPTVVVISGKTKMKGWLGHQDSGQMVASSLLALSRFSSMLGLFDRLDVTVNVTSFRSKLFHMKCHFNPEDYLRCVVPFAEANRSLASNRTDAAFAAFRSQLVPEELATRYKDDSVMPHVSNLHAEGPVALDKDDHEIILSGPDGEWRFRHSTSEPILLLCNGDQHRTPVTVSIAKTGAMATDPLQVMLRALERELTRLGFTYFAFHFTPSEGTPDSYRFRVLLRVDVRELKELVPAASGGSFGGNPIRKYVDSGEAAGATGGRMGPSRGGGGGSCGGGCKLHVGSLSVDTRKETLEQIFVKYGRVSDVIVPSDRKNPGRNRGFGFVTFEEASSAQAAMDDANGIEIDGHNIRVAFASEKPQGGSSSGGGGGRDRDGGDRLGGGDRGGRGRGAWGRVGGAGHRGGQGGGSGVDGSGQ